MVAKDLKSDIAVSHAAFLGKDSLALCYVNAADSSGNFLPQDICGDSTVRHFLRNGNIDAQITSIGPNPTSRVASIDYEVRAMNTPITIEVFNQLGVKVSEIFKNEMHDIGAYRATFDPTGLPSGSYTIRFSTPNFTSSKMIVVTK